MPIGEKQRPEAVVSVTAEDPEPPKKKKDKAEENLAQARKELKENTELVRDLVSLPWGGWAIHPRSDLATTRPLAPVYSTDFRPFSAERGGCVSQGGARDARRAIERASSYRASDRTGR